MRIRAHLARPSHPAPLSPATRASKTPPEAPSPHRPRPRHADARSEGQESARSRPEPQGAEWSPRPSPGAPSAATEARTASTRPCPERARRQARRLDGAPARPPRQLSRPTGMMPVRGSAPFPAGWPRFKPPRTPTKRVGVPYLRGWLSCIVVPCPEPHEVRLRVVEPARKSERLKPRTRIAQHVPVFVVIHPLRHVPRAVHHQPHAPSWSVTIR